jgi:alcohol dehydrogenase class IV
MLPDTNWNYPTTVWFGHKRVKDIVNACKQLNITTPLIVTDEALVKLPIMQDLLSPLKEENISYTVFSDVQPNPTKENVDMGVEVFKKYGCDGVIAFGGGSALDAGKTIAFMSNQTLNIWEFEDIGDNWSKADTSNIAKSIAIPTTAGTGSEVGRATVITDSKTHAKKIIFHPQMLPSIVILDPNLTYDLPKHITAWTGIDALVHSLEAYFSPLFHPMAEGIAIESIRLIKENLKTAFNEPHNEDARAYMLVSAMMGATAFQKGLGSVHSLAHTLGGLYNMPHGLANSIILPYAMYQNRSVIKDKAEKICKYCNIQNPSIESLIEYIMLLRKDLEIPNTLKEAKIPFENENNIGELAYKDPSTGTNAKKLDKKDFTKLFKAAYFGDFGILD